MLDLIKISFSIVELYIFIVKTLQTNRRKTIPRTLMIICFGSVLIQGQSSTVFIESSETPCLLWYKQRQIKESKIGNPYGTSFFLSFLLKANKHKGLKKYKLQHFHFTNIY